ncbi:MAG TPA: ATP-binding cassette domain-containing protein [Paracoccaceae bacterium]|nr:ATP-binding cassette domain-containing protein [Paracoccaceae bacterium]
MIDIRELRKSYDTTPVLDGVTLSLPAGGVTSIIGPNGAGKSTLLAIIARLLRRDGGAIELDGLDIARTPTDALARRLALLRQDNRIAARLTVGDLVAFGRYPHSKGRMTTADASHVARAIALVGMEGLEARFLDELSGEQRQRAFIAMTLAQDTDYALFDEPLNNLDIGHAVAVMRLLRRAADELGKTVVIVLHDINFASRWSDRIVAMRAGQIALAGPPQEVVRPELLRELYGIEMRVSLDEGWPVALCYG